MDFGPPSKDILGNRRKVKPAYEKQTTRPEMLVTIHVHCMCTFIYMYIIICVHFLSNKCELIDIGIRHCKCSLYGGNP